ncbi:MAG: hypothetical protein SFV81_11515 [Pirellulaceae bacterium]|nr:hypothetical protein [Pirellulaceae bacterium]
MENESNAYEPSRIEPFERLKITPAVWLELVTRFGKLFSLVAGQPHRVDEFRGRLRNQRYHLRRAARELLGA